MKAFWSINRDHMPNNAATQQGAALDLTPSTRFLLRKLVSGCSASELSVEQITIVRRGDMRPLGWFQMIFGGIRINYNKRYGYSVKH